MPQEYATIEEAVRAAIQELSTVNATKEGIIDFVQGLSVEASGSITVIYSGDIDGICAMNKSINDFRR